MTNLFIVYRPKDWPLEIPGVEVVSAKAYLTDPRYGQMKGAKVFNLCRSYRYQSMGYYVSLLATARHHKPLPTILTIQDLKLPTITRLASDELEEEIQQSLQSIQSDLFTLSIYFGRNLARRHERLSAKLFKLFPAPMLRAEFKRKRNEWLLQNILPIPASALPPEHHQFVVEAAKEYFQNRPPAITTTNNNSRYDLAILLNPAERLPPSNDKAIERFTRAAEKVGFSVEIIEKDDYARLSEFDALFIRETTAVNHYTYRFARRAAAEGLVVIDDPESILRCSNKVYLSELLARHDIPTPRTLVLHSENLDTVAQQIGFPCILKKPDGSFSQGVTKVINQQMLEEEAEKMLEKSDLVLAQEFVPTAFDWRVGIFGNEPLYVCRYHMPRNHWQIIKRNNDGSVDYGKIESLPIWEVPPQVIKTAMRATSLIGDGLYGVDLKQVGKNKFIVIEVNDNPNIDAGYEDSYLKHELYTRIMQEFLERVEKKKQRRTRE